MESVSIVEKWVGVEGNRLWPVVVQTRRLGLSEIFVFPGCTLNKTTGRPESGVDSELLPPGLRLACSGVCFVGTGAVLSLALHISLVQLQFPHALVILVNQRSILGLPTGESHS